MILLTEKGERVHVDIESDWAYEKCVLVEDTVYLKDIWILELSHCNDRFGERFETEWFKDIRFDHEPSKDEIMRAMIMNGMSIYYDVAVVCHAYVIDVEHD